jgi:hypothetical protein
LISNYGAGPGNWTVDGCLAVQIALRRTSTARPSRGFNDRQLVPPGRVVAEILTMAEELERRADEWPTARPGQ